MSEPGAERWWNDMSEPEWAAVDEEERWASLVALNGERPPKGAPVVPSRPGNGSIPTEDSWQPLNLAELPDTPPVQPNLAPAGIVYPGKRHVFSGPQESAKTLAAYAIALEVLRNDPQATVVLIDFEMGAYDTRTRLRELGATDEELGRIAYVEPSRPIDTADVAVLIRRVPSLVVVDAAAGAYDIEGLDDNKRQDVEKFARRYIRGFWQAGIATILLDHVTKDAESRGKYAIGSERKVGGADVHVGFEVVAPIRRGGSGHYKLVTHKDRGGYLQRGKLADLELHSDPETHRITWEFKPAEHAPDDEPFRPTHLMERVSVFLELKNQPATRTEIESNVTGKGKFLRAATDALIREGFALEHPGERGAKLVETSRPYRENNPDNNPPRPPVPTPSHPVPDGVPTSPSSRPPLPGGRDGDEVAGQAKNAAPRPLDDIPF